MSFCTSCGALPQRFQLVLESFLQQPGLPFAEALPEADIQAAFAEHAPVAAEGTVDDNNVADNVADNVAADDVAADDVEEDDDRVYTAPVTLWAFLAQMLFKQEQRSCLAAVARVVVMMASLGRVVSGNTGAYCRARAKLPEVALRRLVSNVARKCEDELPAEWLWCGRRVQLIDGTTHSMPDTPENQAEYPQHGSQKKGLGFPILRLVTVLSFATGMIHDWELSRYMGKETGEPALLRAMLERLTQGEVVLADRCYCSYFLIALLRERGLDVVLRLHQQRTTDFRRGQRLGKDDHRVTWSRPPKPEWMDEATYDRMPESLEVREVQVRVTERGFRTESLVVVTTLFDVARYSRDALTELYRQRWRAEVDLRSIKTTMGLDVLRCHTPEMVRKELAVGFLAYNLIRRHLLQAARQADCSPRELSFTAGMQQIAASWMTIWLLDEATRARVLEAHLSNLAGHVVGDRPDRVEPRAVKRRPKPHKLLTEPRPVARAALLNGRLESREPWTANT